MKKNLSFLGKYLIGFVLVCCAIVFCCTSCDKISAIKGDPVTQEYVDSVVMNNVQNIVNPMFSSVEEVLAFKAKELKAKEVDDIFNQLPDNIIQNVATVCINREGHVSKRAIVFEYQANSKVYDNLPDTTDNSKDISGSKEENPVTKVDTPKVVTPPNNTTRVTQHDTVINGNKYTVKTKTETSYE